MNSLITNQYTIHFNEAGYASLNQFIGEFNPSKIAVLTDSNTSLFCKNHFLSKIAFSEKIIEISISPGEENKILKTCNYVWDKLSEHNLDRNSILINLGGGVVTDLGGFTAATFLRGIAFINIPTSLLAMVDASIGGKTGVDLGVLKNQVGVMANPKMVLIDEMYLKTLPLNHFNSGVAEILKHGLIDSENQWKKISAHKIFIDTPALPNIIYESLKIKNSIVAQDFNENGLRKVLNFGHTFGHAIESYSLSGRKIKPLLHGEAIAAGMILEAYLSYVYSGFPKTKVDEIKRVFSSYFEKIHFTKESIDGIFNYLKFDKKNSNEQVNFVLLKEIGNPVLDNKVLNSDLTAAFNYYLE